MKNIQFDTKTLPSDAAAVKDALGGLPAVADRAAKSLGSLDDKLLVLRLNLGKLRAALERAFAPIAATVVPVVNTAVRGLTSLVNDAARVISALFGTVQEEAVTTTKVTGSAVKKSLASFDQIERLNGSSGGGTVETVTTPKVSGSLSPQLQAVVDKVRELLAPLKKIDLSPAAEAFHSLGQAVALFAKSLFDNLEWAWHNLLVPLGKWTIEAAVPAAIHAVTAAFSMLRAILNPLLEGFQSFLPVLTPIAQFLGQQVVRILEGLGTLLNAVGQAFTQESGRIQQTFSTVGEIVSRLWTWIEPLLTGLGELGASVMSGLTEKIRVGISSVSQTLSGFVTFLAGVLSADWERAWGGLETGALGILAFLEEVFLEDWKSAWQQVCAAVETIWTGLQEKLKTPINGIIGFLNKLLSGITAGINAMIRGLNALSFTVPNWVPVLGGERFGFNLSTVKTPQIPYLAQGAVLPANHPFLAVVGDQRSGTNVEAPLSTIQEAVAAVMDGQISAMMAGFEALLQENRQLRAAVESIEVGDTVIGQAAARYERRRTLARGGVL